MTETRASTSGWPEVALVSLPFGNVLSPSFGLSLLAAGLRRAGLECRVHYFTFAFARRMGAPLYRQICDGGFAATAELPGEWIFSRALFGRRARGAGSFAAHVLRPNARRSPAGTSARLSPARWAALVRARRLAGAFLDECAAALLRERPRLVGFTSVFQQHVASLALAQRLKRADPALLVVFGGANCEGPMGAETLRQFPFVDALVSGEADLVFPELVRRALAGRSLRGLPGVLTPACVTRDFDAAAAAGAPPVNELDALPAPDYSDFFEQFARSGFARRWRARVFFESSRGCWWGAKHHCTFCGLNGQTMQYRSKSSGRALDELLQLAERHPGSDVQVVDNILDWRYFGTLLPELAARGAPLDLFYETKSNLDRAQVALLRAAGVRSIQPGIESLSDALLGLMRKGVSALQNVLLLRLCRELGVQPYWNVLWGFPREDPAEYARQAALVPLLAHLPPPVSFAGLRLDRFSPNFTRAAELGLVDVRPLRVYREIYPLDDAARSNLAYHFRFRHADGRDPATYVGALLRALRQWQLGHREAALVRFDCDAGALLLDLRACARDALTWLTADDAALYRACDSVRGLAALATQCGREPAQAAARLEPLVARGLLLRDGERYLALATAPLPGARRARSGQRTLAPEWEQARDAPGLRVASRVGRRRLARLLSALGAAGAARASVTRARVEFTWTESAQPAAEAGDRRNEHG